MTLLDPSISSPADLIAQLQQCEKTADLLQKTVPGALRAYRLVNRVNVPDLAKGLKVTKAMVYMWEKGDRELTWERFEQVVKAIDKLA